MAVHVLRYDDFSTCSNQAVEEQLIELLGRNRLPCTFGVIPFVCDPQSLLRDGAVKLSPVPKAKAALLKPLLDEGLGEVALHGYSHIAFAPLRGHQEFSHLMPKETQRRLIQRGRSYLEDLFGVRVRVFIPPWNRLAPATAQVLQEEGLFLSGDMAGPSDSSCVTLPQVPCSTSLAQTAGALKAALRLGKSWNSVGTIMHDYDFCVGTPSFWSLPMKEFEELILRWKGLKGVKGHLISTAILDEPEARAERGLANAVLQSGLSKSRVGRKLLPTLRSVWWDTHTARRLAQLIKYLP